jgi:hypothetical protein
MIHSERVFIPLHEILASCINILPPAGSLLLGSWLRADETGDCWVTHVFTNGPDTYCLTESTDTSDYWEPPYLSDVEGNAVAGPR